MNEDLSIDSPRRITPSHFLPALPIFALLLLAGCATRPVTSPALLARLTPAWIASAQRIQSGDRTIYYHGQARGAAEGAAWAGTVRGEILALDPAMAIVIPAGTLTLTPSQSLSISGPQHIITSDAPAWKHLLRP